MSAARRWIVGIACGLSLMPAVNRGVAGLLEKIRRPSPSARRWAALAIAVLAGLYLLTTTSLQARDLTPKVEDECSFVIATRMMGIGRLWMPKHPMADFFESIFLIVRPVYCSIYFPGTALLFAPMVWLHLATWVLPLVVSGAIVGLVYLLVTELIDGVAGTLSAVWMVALGFFRTLSVMVMSHLPMLLFGLLMLHAWLRWRKTGRLRWAIALGVFAGWSAITRPADAVAYAIPIGIAMLWEFRRLPPRRSIATAALVVCGAAPLLAVQAVFDVGVTGHVLLTPYTLYLHQDLPGTEFGIRKFNRTVRPQSKIPEKQAYYDMLRMLMYEHQPNNFWQRWFVADPGGGGLNHAYSLMIADATLPGRALLLLLPVGLLGLGDPRKLVVAATAPAFIGVYVFNPFFLEHYPLVIAPAMILCVLIGANLIAGLLPRWRANISATLTVGILALSVTALPEIKRWTAMPGETTSDGWLENGTLATIDEELPRMVQAPAVVLFRSEVENPFEDPVYNTDVAWPDDAPIIHARDLGSRDTELVRYYAERQPDRMFYGLDMKTRVVTPLGKAGALLEQIRRGNPATAPSAPRGR